MSQHLPIETLAVQCETIIANARKVLGYELRGYSVLDLVADNIDYANLDDLKKALKQLGVIK